MIGVYLLVKDFDIIYVGSSKNMELRIEDHKNKDYDYYVLLPTKTDHKGSERSFISCYKPILNKYCKYNWNDEYHDLYKILN